MDKINISYTDWNIANNIDGDIELNKNLKNYPKLHQAILDHEIRHNETNSLVVDFGEHKVNNVELLKFMIKNPKSLTQFLPITYSRKHGWLWDLNVILTYVGLAAGIILIYFLVFS